MLLTPGKNMRFWSALAMVFMLSACSGDEGGSPLAQTVPGIYMGNAINSGDPFAVIIAPDGLTYLFNFHGAGILSAVVGGPETNITGELKNYDPGPWNAYVSHASFSGAGSFSGKWTVGAPGALNIDFTVGATTDTISAVADFNNTSIPADMALIAGTWHGEDGANFTTITIDAGGALTGIDNAGCTYSGNVRLLRPDINVYNLKLRIAPCSGYPEQRFTGITLRLPDMSVPLTDPDVIVIFIDNGEDATYATLTRQ